MKLYKEDLLVNIVKLTEMVFEIFCPSEDMADFLHLQGKLEPMTLRMFFFSNKPRAP